MGRTNSFHPTTQIVISQITLVIISESTDQFFGELDSQHSLYIVLLEGVKTPTYTVNVRVGLKSFEYFSSVE